MKVHLDRGMRLVMHPEQTLYSWAIDEVDAEGVAVGLDQIPWEWSQTFTATELVLSETLSIELPGQLAKRIPTAGKIENRRVIRAKLRSGNPRVDPESYRNTTYRMFGTDRPIKDIQLDVLPLDTDEEEEACSAWGAVQYTAEFDFRDETIDDCIVFFLAVKPQTFERFATRIAERTADEVMLTVGRVDGFYSNWSPSVSTSRIKVLTGTSDHVVATPGNEGVQPPRLGKVGQVALNISARRISGRQDVEHSTPEVVSTALLDADRNADRPVALDPVLAQRLQSLNWSARWIIFFLAAVLAAILLKN